jgi:hypothetical protein
MNGLAEPTELTAGVGFDGDTAVGMIGDVELEDYLTTKRAEEVAAELGHRVTRRSIARAARRWYEDRSETGIAGCVKLGDLKGTSGWMIPRQSFLDWLETRKPRGPKTSKEGD